MKDQAKPKEQLIRELEQLRQQVALLQKSTTADTADEDLSLTARTHPPQARHTDQAVRHRVSSAKEVDTRKARRHPVHGDDSQEPEEVTLLRATTKEDLSSGDDVLSLERERPRDRYSSLYDFLAAGYFTLDATGSILEVNFVGNSFGGLVGDDVIAKKFSSIVWPGDNETYSRHLKQVFKSTARQSCQVNLTKKDGVLFRARLESVPLLDSDGRFTRCRTVVFDVSEPGSTEEALRRTKDALEALLNATTESAFLLDREGNLLILNETIAGKLGGKIDELVGKSIFTFLPKDLAGERMEWLDEVIRTGRPVMYENERDGQYFSNSTYPVFGPDGSVEAVAVYSRDITDGKLAESQLKWESEVNSALAQLYIPLISPSSSIHDVTSAVLKMAKKLTRSEHGYVSEVDPETHANVGHTLTEMMKDQCSIPEGQRGIVFPIGPDDAYGSLWGHALNTRTAFFTNAPESHPASRGLPESHIPIRRFLSVPVLLGNELVGQIALANAKQEYTDRDLEAVKRLAQYYAMAVQRKRVEKAVVQAHDLLERRVEERTAELAEANRELQTEIFERARAEKAARQSEEHFRAIFEAARDCVFMKDKSLKYVLVNPAMESLLGIPAAKIEGMNDQELFGAKVGRHLEEVDLRVLDGQMIEEEHTRPVRGIPTTFLDIKAPIRNTLNEIVGICGISRNITERRKILEVPETGPTEYPSKTMRATYAEARMAARSDSIVLLTGESGSGKDYLARFIHRNSRRAGGHFFSINCAAVPHELAESELFGHEAGAFTGAKGRARGLLELAEGGTLLLNEIGELPLALQAKLLTFFDTRTFTRVGGRSAISVSARIIAATNRDLEHLVKTSKFRADLYYRLNVMSLRVPPLRERIDDLPILVQQILHQLAGDLRLHKIPEIPAHIIVKLSEYHWPGNIRELRNVLERALIISKGERIERLPVRSEAPSGKWIFEVPFPEGETLDDITRRVKRCLVQEALRRSNGVRKDAASLLGISRHALKRYIKSLDIASGIRT